MRLSLLAVAPVLAAGLLAGPRAGAVTAGGCPPWNGSQPVNPAPNGLNQLESIAVGTLTMTPDCTLPAGDVLTQSPLSGAQAAPGTPVNLTESTGRKANGTPCVIE